MKDHPLRILTANALPALKCRRPSRTDKEDASLSMMPIGRAPPLVRAVGFKIINDVTKYVRDDVLESAAYRLFADAIAHSENEQIPMEHTHWRIWRLLLIRFHLFEVADIRSWAALISRFDSRGIRAHPPNRPPAPSVSATDPLRGINGRFVRFTTSGYVDLDLAGCQTRLRACLNFQTTRGICAHW